MCLLAVAVGAFVGWWCWDPEADRGFSGGAGLKRGDQYILGSPAPGGAAFVAGGGPDYDVAGCMPYDGEAQREGVASPPSRQEGLSRQDPAKH